MLRSRPGRRVEREIRRLGEETLGLRLVLLAQQRAGDIGEAARRVSQARCARKNVVLADLQFGEIVGVARHLASGLRRQLPTPRHGASTSTRSKLLAWRLTQGSRSLDSAWRSTLLAPARRSR